MNLNDIADPIPRIKTNVTISQIRSILLSHQYEFIRPLAHGTYGNVYLIRSIAYNTYFALKQQRLKEITNQIQEEIEAMKKLLHKNIISLYQYFYEDDILYLILEYCPGGCLQNRISHHNGIPVPKLYDYCFQILSALEHCHSHNIVHRDIKPSNILIDSYGRCKLSDFGLSKTVPYGEFIHEFYGTSLFMAPEIHQHRPYDPYMADIWSLGLTFYVLGTGQLPWIISSPEDIRRMIIYGAIESSPLLEPRFMSIIRMMLNPNPSKRPTAKYLLSMSFFSQAFSSPSKKNQKVHRYSIQKFLTT